MNSSRAPVPDAWTVSFPPFLVSGGQTGADRAGLDFAIAQGLQHAGYCSAGRQAEDGRLSDSYNLTETKSGDYTELTRKNVRLSDATVIFSLQPLAVLRQIPRGNITALTVHECEGQGRPLLVLVHFPDFAADATELKAFLLKYSPRVLNVTGSEENKISGIYIHFMAVLALVAADLPKAVDLSSDPS